jgi:DnaJ-class molecular chaperone
VHIKDYYTLLQVDKNASQEEIKKAYWKIARKYHPDFHPNNKYKQQKMCEINEAYEVLRHQGRRREYDKLFGVQPVEEDLTGDKLPGLWEKSLSRVGNHLDRILSKITDDTAVFLFLLAIIVGLLIFILVPPPLS